MSVHRPFLPKCFLHWTDTTGAGGEDMLRLVSWRRNLTLKGTSFADFEREVLPLLTGELTLDEICEQVSGTFGKEDVAAAIDMLASQGIVIEADERTAGHRTDRLDTQMGWLAEIAPEGRAAQDRLSSAHVVLFGAGQHGACAARSLVAAGLGRVTIMDPANVGPTDSYFSGMFRMSDVGRNRAEALCDALSSPGCDTVLEHSSARPASDAEMNAILQGKTLALCCLDAGELKLALALNRACIATGLPWIASSLEGTEVVVGPGFYDPQNSPCYQCWRTREIAASAKPETRFALENHLEGLETDLSHRRENLAPAVDIAGGLLAGDVLSWLTNAGYPALDGRFLTVTLPGLRVEKHMVLRKPGCPACVRVSHE